MATRVALILLVVVAALAATTTDASACSCGSGDPRNMLAAADAAFVGTLVEEPSGPFSNSGQLAPYVFEVEHAVKGRLPKRIEVVSAVSSASCGIGARVGDRIGLFLRRVDGQWHSTLCERVSPEQLLAAARPLPAPTGTGPVALLAGGKFGDVRTIALDQTGRTLGYGRGRGTVILLDACPGGSRAVEIAWDGPGPWLAVRDLRTMRLVREQPLRLGQQLLPKAVDCRTRSGDTALLFASGEGPLGVIRRYRGARSTELHRGRGVSAVFGASHAYLTVGELANRLVAVDLERGTVRQLGAVPNRTSELELSPDGTRLAAVAPGAPGDPLVSAPRSRVVVFDLRTRRPTLRSAPLRAYAIGNVGWLNDGVLVFMPDGGDKTLRVYDTSMRLRSRLDWPARLGAIRDGIAYGITWGNERRVLRAELPGGRPRSDATLPGTTVNVLEAVS